MHLWALQHLPWRDKEKLDSPHPRWNWLPWGKFVNNYTCDGSSCYKCIALFLVFRQRHNGGLNSSAQTVWLYKQLTDSADWYSWPFRKSEEDNDIRRTYFGTQLSTCEGPWLVWLLNAAYALEVLSCISQCMSDAHGVQEDQRVANSALCRHLCRLVSFTMCRCEARNWKTESWRAYNIHLELLFNVTSEFHISSFFLYTPLHKL